MLSYLLNFNRIKRELSKNGFFIALDDEFVVGEKKYKTKWASLLDKYKEKAPIGVFNSLEEVRAFAIGFSIGQRKEWKY